MQDFRIDDHVKSADDIAKAAGITDPGEVATFKALYGKHPGAAAALANACAKSPGAFAKLTAAWGDAAPSKVTTTGGDMVNIAGELEISTARLASMDDAQLKDLLKVCESPSTHVELAKKFEGGDTRFRFKSRVDARIQPWLTTMLTELGLDPHNPPEIFKNMTQADRDGLWLVSTEGGRGDNPTTRPAAAKWALGRNPGSARQFTSDFQYFIGEVDAEAGRIASGIDAKANTEIAKLEASQGGRKASDKQKQSIYKAITKQPVADGGLGAEFVNTTGKGAKAKLRELAVAKVSAGGADAAHAQTVAQLSGDYAVGATALSSPDPVAMGAEIVAPGGNEVETYLNSARETIGHGTMASPVLSADGKSYSFSFTRGIGMVVVKVTIETGVASIATYMPGKVK